MTRYIRGEGFWPIETDSFFQSFGFRGPLIGDIEESNSRATGVFGADQVCVPSDADAWFQSLKRPFTIRQYNIVRDGPNGPVQRTVPARWATYQVNKCGSHECSVHEDRSRSKAPIADGINPSRIIIGTSTGAHACLILDAKSSNASERNSLYGIHDNDYGFWDWVRWRNRPPKRRVNPRRQLLDSADTVLDTLNVLMGENGALIESLRRQSFDPEIIEDTPDDDASPFAEERDETDSAHRAVRYAQITQMMEYERACCVPSEVVPLTKYLIIVERTFMVEYFRSILTPNGIVVQSAYSASESWAP